MLEKRKGKSEGWKVKEEEIRNGRKNSMRKRYNKYEEWWVKSERKGKRIRRKGEDKEGMKGYR